MNERETLLARAKELNIAHPANIGDDKLKAKIAETEAEVKAKADADAKAKADADAKAKADADAKAKADADAKAKADADAKAKADADAKAKADAAENSEADRVDLVVVKGPERGRWRIGRHFTREAVEIPRDELGDGELKALEDDPELIVSIG
ncbi:MAG: hypothetical protein ABNH14_10680 [Pseudophaeobacter sp.]|jgi:hypothetical protein|uniref:hypothetical protein n=1 Tax=Pseudophaeobacter sp. TaxID=1971739 RepID=UPI0032D8BFD8